MRALLPVLLLALAAGCLDAPPPRADPGGALPPAPRQLSGAFKEEASQADLAEAQRLSKAEGGDMAILESFPMQFSVKGLDAGACARLREALAAEPYVARVG